MTTNAAQSINLDEIYAFAKDLTISAGRKLIEDLEVRGDRTSSKSPVSSLVEKENAVDVVTKTDEDIEYFIRQAIRHSYPSHAFIGEENYSKSAGSDKAYAIDSGTPTWCVDPLDGTVNYVHAFPTFCVSVAFILFGRPVVGVIVAPLLNQVFHACADRGAWLTTTFLGRPSRDVRLPLFNNPVPPLPATAPKGCLFSFEWGKDRRDRQDGNLHRKIESFTNMAVEVGGRAGKGGMVHGMRSLGSAALDLAYTAMGGSDIWWEGGCWEWDVAAGMVILREAGGIITTANPPEDIANAPVEEAKLGSRLYLAIRPTGPSEEGESGAAQQERLVREVWRRVSPLDYNRPGL